MMDRRQFGAIMAALASQPAFAMSRPAVIVHRSPTCGCCGAWANHLRRAGFPVTIVNEADMAPVKSRAGVPDALQSCHTAFVEGYVIEGHVTLEAIEKLLAERPQILGLAVPDMPVGSPGMEMPDTKPDPFSVMAFHKDGNPTVFVDYPNGYRRLA